MFISYFSNTIQHILSLLKGIIDKIAFDGPYFDNILLRYLRRMTPLDKTDWNVQTLCLEKSNKLGGIYLLVNLNHIKTSYNIIMISH